VRERFAILDFLNFLSLALTHSVHRQSEGRKWRESSKRIKTFVEYEINWNSHRIETHREYQKMIIMKSQMCVCGAEDGILKGDRVCKERRRRIGNAIIDLCILFCIKCFA
jgi:hypothetical protein